MNGQYVNRASVPDWQEGLLGLMYHAIEAPPLFHPLRGLYVTPSLLDKQLNELQDESSISFTTLSDWARSRCDGKQVLLTFDDAFLSVFVSALPILQKRKLTAITYVVGGEVGGINRWDSKSAQVRPLMSKSEIMEWLAAGQEVGAHTLSHCNLSEVPVTQARSEIFDGKKLLEDLTGREVRHFCYPYGGWNEVICSLVEEAGYETSTTAHPGINDRGTNLFLIRRYLACHRKPYLTALSNGILHPFGGARLRRSQS